MRGAVSGGDLSSCRDARTTRDADLTDPLRPGARRGGPAATQGASRSPLHGPHPARRALTSPPALPCGLRCAPRGTIAAMLCPPHAVRPPARSRVLLLVVVLVRCGILSHAYLVTRAAARDATCFNNVRPRRRATAAAAGAPPPGNRAACATFQGRQGPSPLPSPSPRGRPSSPGCRPAGREGRDGWQRRLWPLGGRGTRLAGLTTVICVVKP